MFTVCVALLLILKEQFSHFLCYKGGKKVYGPHDGKRIFCKCLQHKEYFKWVHYPLTTNIGNSHIDIGRGLKKSKVRLKNNSILHLFFKPYLSVLPTSHYVVFLTSYLIMFFISRWKSQKIGTECWCAWSFIGATNHSHCFVLWITNTLRYL